MAEVQASFLTHVVGPANRLAVTAARAVVDAPGTVYNPLFIHGVAGLGKTHLLQAIAHEAAQRHPDLAVEHLGVQEFLEDLGAASASGRAEVFRRRFQGADLLLLDDVQDLAGRADAQSEVLRLMNAMQASGRQVVMAADRPPGAIPDLDGRLLNRLSGGLVVEVGAPDADTRLAWLRQVVAERNLAFAAGVLEELARSAVGNLRELHGALNRLVAHQAMVGHAIAPQDVWQVLGEARIPAGPDEFTTFLEDVASSVAASVESWRTHLAERIAWWSGQGYRTAILEQALDLEEPPNVEELDTAFQVVVDRLGALECEAIRCDAAHAGLPLFRDPDRLQEAEQFVARATARRQPPAAPDPKWRLQDFPRTAMTRPALVAAQQLVVAPGRLGYLMCVVGPAQSGKTHLAHGIGNALQVAWPDARIACVRAQELAGEVVRAIEAGELEAWHARWREVQGLVVDDLQDLDGRERVQQEVATLADALRRDARAVVVTSDRLWDAFHALSPRLRTLLESGARVQVARATPADAVGRFTPVPDGDEAAAPNIDVTPAQLDAIEAGHEVEGTWSAPAALDTWFLDTEKVVITWPDLTGRLVEELG